MFWLQLYNCDNDKNRYTIFLEKAHLNPNSEGVPATHLSEGGGHIVPPPGKYSINGPN